MSFKIRKFRNFIFYEQNWAIDYRVGCKSPSNLLELIRIDVDLEEELEQIWRSFLKKMKLWIYKLLKIYLKSILLSKKIYEN